MWEIHTCVVSRETVFLSSKKLYIYIYVCVCIKIHIYIIYISLSKVNISECIGNARVSTDKP